MKISSEEIVLVMSLFKNNLQGLSISEISRKSRIYRNKVAKISDDLCRDGIITCTQKGSSKIYTLKVRSTIHPLLEILTDPWLILDNQFRIIEVNEAYLEKKLTELQKILGLNFFDTADSLVLPFRQEDILEMMDSKNEGEKRIYETKNGFERYSCLQISLNEEMRGILIVIQTHPAGNTTDQNLKTLCRTLEGMFDNLTEIVQKPYLEVSSLVAEIIHDKFPDTMVSTIRIDESELSGQITKILAPKSILRRAGTIIDSLQRTPFHIPPLTLMRYKTGKPYLHEDISVFLEEYLSHEALEEIREVLQFYSVFLIGILQNGVLTEIFVIGVNDGIIQPEVYSKVLQSISNIFFTADLIEQKNKTIQQNLSEYQLKYKEIYHLLSEKIKEEKIHAGNATHVKNLLFMVMDTIKIPVLVTNKSGTILGINRTGEELFKPHKKVLMSDPSIRDILAPETSESLIKLIENKEELQNLQEPYPFIHDIGHEVPLIWYLVKNRIVQMQESYIFIAEPLPGSLIQYLIDQGM